jgi:hypothetical protein
MRAMSVMRFIVFGAVGFGIGWAVGGLSAIIAPMWSPYISYSFAGACGGAALGLALRDSKRVATLALIGLVGFGLGTYLMFILGFIGLLPGRTSVAMGTGLFGGAMLGLAFVDWKAVAAPFSDWKTIATLGLAGMVGFGIGGAITAALQIPFVLLPFETDFVELRQAPLLLLQHLLIQTVIGLIGGASLGAALGYLENRKLAQGQRPRVR